MADKNLEIRISATGGPQASAEVGKLEKSIQGAADATEELGEKSSEAADRVSEIANRQRAQAIADLGQAFAQVSGFVRQTAEAFAEADPELSRTLTNAADGLNSLTSAATMAAQGFAVGGPLGAGIGALVGVALPEFKNAMDEAVTSMVAAAEAEQRATDMQAQLDAALAMGADAYFDAVEAADTYKEKSAEVLAAIEAEIEALERRNKLTKSKRELDAAERDKQDAERIRAGESPEQVKSERVQFDAEQKKAAIDDETALAEKKMQESAAKLQEAEKALEALKNDPRRQTMTKEQRLDRDIEIANADAARSTAGMKFLDDRLNFETTRDVNSNRKAAIDSQADASQISIRDRFEKQREAEAQREIQKREREEAAAARKAEAAAAKAKREEAIRKRADLRDKLDGAEDSLDADARDKGLKVRKRGLSTGNDTLQAVGKALADGTDAAELQKLGDMVREASAKNGAAMTAALLKLIADLNTQAQQIEQIKSQIKKGNR